MEHTNISLYLLLVIFSASIQATVRNPQTMIETLPAYAMAVNNNILNISRCQMEMEKFRVAVDRGVLWGLRILESNGEAGSRFLSGNNYWTGDRHQCHYLTTNTTLAISEKTFKNNSKYRNPEEEFPPFQLQFFSAQIIHNSTLQYHIQIEDEDIIILGLCLPASCTKHEVGKMLKKVFDDRTLLIGQLYAADFKLINVSDLTNDTEWLVNGRIIVIILVLMLLCCTIIAGTMYDLIIHQRRLRRKKEFLTFENNNTSEMKNDMEEKRDTDHEESTLSELKPENCMEQVLMSFSAYSNVLQVFNTDSDNVQMFHGMKFLGMTWIIIGHTLLYGDYIIANKVMGYIMADSVIAQILSNTTFAVDTYFFISGFLLTLLYYKSLQGEKKPAKLKRQVYQYFSSLVKRYIRLTPPHAVVIMISILNFTWYEKVSLFRYSEEIHMKCSTYWWRNLLYINNLFNWNELCLSWSWYLSNDMQFFMFGSFLMILSSRYFYAAVSLGAVSFISSIIINAYTAYSIDYIPTLDMQYATLTWLYMRPWNRIPPYLIGMATAHLLTKWNYKLHLSSKVVALCWTIGAFCNLGILYATVNKYLPLSLSVLYVGLNRTIWTIGISWVVIACYTNHGGVVNKFLSMKVWIPLGRLTYCAYLFNPFLIISISLYSAYPTVVDVLTTGASFLGIVVVSYVCAIVLSITTEVPFIRILRLLVNRERRRK
ncbi:Nose resistant to fluoxetine protein 6 [Anthophora quadrimaculata]